MLIKFLTLFLAVMMPLPSVAQQSLPLDPSHCENHAPYGFPILSRNGTVLICRTGYVLLHDGNARIPSWVSYGLDAERVLGCEPRVNAFATDHSLPRGQRAETSDYSGSGFDMGHMANSADMSWNRQVARESFILSNITPQLPSLNRGAWRQLETAVRSWAFSSNQGLTIYTGPVYGNGDRRIGSNGVVVPSAFYKIVIDNHRRQSLAFLFPHRDVDDFRSIQTTVYRIEQETGIRFFVPDDKNSMNRVWNINLSSMMSAKRRRCRG